MSNDVLRAALALATLNDRDREWILSQLGSTALQRLQAADAQLQGEDLGELAEKLDTQFESDAIDSDSNNEISVQEQILLPMSEKIILLLKNEPAWLKAYILASFSEKNRLLLVDHEDKAYRVEYPELPKGLHLAILQSLQESMDLVKPTEDH